MLHTSAMVTGWAGDRTMQITSPAGRRLLAWSDVYVPVPHVQVIQDGRVLASRRLPWLAAPGRVFRIPSSLLTRAGARPKEGTIRIALANAPRPEETSSRFLTGHER